MNRISSKKINFIIVLVAIFAAFAIISSLSVMKSDNNGRNNVVYATGEDITLLETKAKVSVDEKYLLLVTGFDPTNLKNDGYYYMGYKYTVGGENVDTARALGAQAARYYASVTLRTDLEDPSKTHVVMPEDIYGEGYEGYKLLVYEIEFTESVYDEIADYSNICAYIDEVEKVDEEWEVANSNVGTSFTFKSKYFPANNDFETGTLTGWERADISLQNDKHFAGISDAETFWGEGYTMNSKGYYLSSYAGDADEAATGTLTSGSFTLGGCGYVTYMLGGAGNPLCYITVEKYEASEWSVVAVYRNTAFTDFPAGEYTLEEKRAMIGDTVFLANFVTFKADLRSYIGDTLRFVIHDEAVNAWGVVYFDDLVTYYSKVEKLPDGAVAAVNELADKSALQTAIAGAIGSQGDYTDDSYAAYTSALSSANTVNDYVASTQAAVDSAVSALATATSGLTYRLPATTSESSARSFVLAPLGTQSVTISDHVDENSLSSITYEVASGDTGVATVSAISEGAFTITAVDDGETTVTLTVKHLGESVHTVTFAVDVSTVPTLLNESVSVDLDLYELVNKTNYTADFTANVSNLGGLDLTYSATMKVGNGSASAISLTNNGYTYAYAGPYNDTAVVVTFAVTVSYEHNGSQSLNYNYVLNITDSTAYRLANGDFETGDLTGWTLSNAALGDVIENGAYWDNKPFNRDGTHLFSAYTVLNGSGYAQSGNEGAKGTLTSSTFVVGGSGYITYKLGAAKNADGVWIDVIDNSNGNILGRYYNDCWDNSDCTLIPYKVDLSSHKGKTVYLRVVDNATSDYGLFFLDSVTTYYASAPTGDFNTAAAVANVPANIYSLYNGGFETGNLSGWAFSTQYGDFGHVTAADNFFSGNTYNKDGTYLFSGIEDQGAGNGVEGGQGTLTSAPFVIGGADYITFKLGGGINPACYIEVLELETGALLARYHHDSPSSSGANPEGVMVRYKAYLGSGNAGKTAVIRVCDYAWHAWGCMAVDSFVTYYTGDEDILDECTSATDHKYEVVNCSFETGALEGWTMDGDLGAVVNSEKPEDWYQTNDGRKDGDWLFTFYGYDLPNKEGGTGYLRSKDFVLGANGIISFRLGAALNTDDQVYVTVRRASDGAVLAKFFNRSNVDATGMVYYYYQFDNAEEIQCYFEVDDYATGNYYGCFVVDDFRVNLNSTPAGVAATDEK
ncbi:MAG: FIVAR domain-containing protein [Clostridia bacterium]|nr:FIVAR domain-containing protein [Clostridia bacterium]